ncbi:MAG: iron-containing alcohol dehydrogenase [Bdellovibrionales bacterium]|nr:iron-containing alcohol dehydrogenase [Bdellovibrionales bacterium]
MAKKAPLITQKGSVYGYNYPTRVRFGAGVRAELPGVLKSKGLNKVLIVTDKGFAGLPVFQQFESELKSAGLDVKTFSGIWGNPVKSQVTAGTQAAKAHGTQALIAIGGGAALDVGKVIALMMNHPGDLFDYEDGNPSAPPVDKAMPFIVGIPTTAGTGSEVGRSSVVSDDQTHRKVIIFDPRLLPQLVIADPELSLGLPPLMTAATGIDALTHLVEAYLAKGFHPMADGIALEGIKLTAKWLPITYQHAKKNLGKATPEHIEARGMMLNAAMMGAAAFQKGLGVNHSCAHALSTVADLHHGTANGIMLDACMAHNAKAVPERFKEMAHALRLPGGKPAAFLKWVAKLKKQLELPLTLADANVDASKIPALVDVAEKDVCHPSNPVAITRKDFEKLFKASLGKAKKRK